MTEMKKGWFLVVATVVMLITACSIEVPMELRINTKQVSIEGNTARAIHTDTADIVLIRDSIADEASGLYCVRTSVDIVLDSIFYTDQMEDSLTLKFLSADGDEQVTMFPTDSLISDTLTAFLQNKVGERVSVFFEGKMSGKSILKLQEGGKVVLAGFSFIYADPKITKTVNDYYNRIQAIRTIIEKARTNPERMKSMEGFVIVLTLQEGFNQVEKINKKLISIKDQMSPLQYAKFKEAHDIMKTYDKDLK